MESESTVKNLDAYEKWGSVKGVTKETGYSWNKIVKTLSSAGIIVNDTHSAITKLYAEGKDYKEIAKLLNINERTALSYLPRTRPVYGENQSYNAQKIVKCRANKKE